MTISVANGGSGGEGSPAPANRPPVASFSISKSVVGAGKTMGCNAASSWDPDGNIASYQWAFGDGAWGSGESVTHAYNRSGTYVITLTVIDEGQLRQSATRQVTVR